MLLEARIPSHVLSENSSAGEVKLYVIVYFGYISVSMLFVQVDVFTYSILIIFAIFLLSFAGILTFICYCSRWPPH